MDCVLNRQKATANGVFGALRSEAGVVVSFTLEHAYPDGKGGFVPKVAPGIYTCLRGLHQLQGMRAPFVTFCVQEVPDFQGLPVTGILFHCGNFNQDSEGCILMGSIDTSDFSGILGSRADFSKFMGLQVDCDQFTLVVK